MPGHNVLLVPTDPSTINRIVEDVRRWVIQKKMSKYAIAKAAGMTVHHVDRFFDGNPSGEKNVRGCVRFDTALRITQAVGLDLQVVVREAPIKGQA
ncbi:MAG: hypothetical protein KIPDCIKN_04354 [Haliscomenobacter sp.]|nr:hypothetical protein [Haliscomenobacter sp.]